MVTIDLDLVKRIVLVTVGLVIAGLMAFKGTHDLDHVENRLFYRLAAMMLYVRGIMFMFEMFGWLSQVE